MLTELHISETLSPFPNINENVVSMRIQSALYVSYILKHRSPGLYIKSLSINTEFWSLKSCSWNMVYLPWVIFPKSVLKISKARIP